MISMAFADEKVRITDDFRWNLLHRKATEIRVANAFALFRKHSIEPILIKGFAAAQFYPETKLRDSVDIDLAVSAADFELAAEISLSDAANGIAIDLHRELRHLDTLPWQDLYKHSRELKLADAGSIRILRPEDHLRVLCVHWLTDGGSNKDRLWDIYYMIENRAVDFDWDRFLNTVGVKRRRWLICALGLASYYLDLDLAGTPAAGAADNVPPWLKKTVEREWASGSRYVSLHASLGDRKVFMTQVLKRIRPNPIWATIDVEGSFDAKTRVFYQVGSTLKRIAPSIRRIAGSLRKPPVTK